MNLQTSNGWMMPSLALLIIGAFFVYLTARLLARRNDLLAALTAMVFTLALGALIPTFFAVRRALHAGSPMPTWGRFETGDAFLRADPGALVIIGVALGLGALVAIYSGRYLALDRRYETFYPLLLLLVTGLAGMVLAADLFNLYMFCELMSVAAYALVAFRRRTSTAIEAGFKYLIMGSVGTIIILLGISFIYRESGQLLLPAPGNAPGGDLGAWTRVGTACFLVGLGVKSAIVPLHTWLPDAHGRAPSSISAMLSGIVIQSAFYAMLKVGLGLGLPARYLGAVLIALSLLNMTVGNGMALVQTYTKRLLGYSTVAQMGYVMLSVGVGLRYNLPAAIQAGFFLLLAHAAMKGLAFLCKGVCHFYYDTTTIPQLRGTAVQLPLVGIAFSVALAGLAGVPPLAGFVGKWFILTRALQASDRLVYLALTLFLLNSLIGLGYYLPLIGALFTLPDHAAQLADEGSEKRVNVKISPWMALPLVILGVLVLVIGLYPGPWLGWAGDVGLYLFALGAR